MPKTIDQKSEKQAKKEVIETIDQFWTWSEKQAKKELSAKPKCPNVLCIGNTKGRCVEEMTSCSRRSVKLCKKRELFVQLKDEVTSKPLIMIGHPESPTSHKKKAKQ